MLVGEVWLADADRFARYLRPGRAAHGVQLRLHGAPGTPPRLRDSVERTLAVHARVGAPATWVLSNHDVTRPVTRYGRTDTAFAFETKRFGTPTDLRSVIAGRGPPALLAMALPGAFYLFQGEELGLPEVEVPRDRIEDPMHSRSGGVDPGRDGCRVPLPWAGDAPPYGFSSAPVETWLPQPADWAALTVEAQEQDPASMLTLYRSGLALRRDLPELGAGTLTWDEPGTVDDGTSTWWRSGAATGSSPSPTSAGSPSRCRHHREILLASERLEGGRLPADTTAWLRLS